MFRVVLLCLLASSTWKLSEAQDNPIIEYLSNLNIPGFGNSLSNMIDNLSRTLPGPSLDGENRPATGSVNKGNFSFTRWSAFGGCSKVCGGGSRSRSRSCLNETGHEVTVDKCITSQPLNTYDLYKILSMRKAVREVEEELCNKHDCRVSDWELDESCSRKCGGGFMTHSRICYDSSDQKKCNFQSTKLTPCNTNACFTVGPWQEWSRCTAPCGGGRSSRKRDCRPNFPSYSPLYRELEYALELVTQPQALRTVEDESKIFYFSQYLSSCGSRLAQSRFCNANLCPRCPKNQVYHTCKPCTRMCRKIHINDISGISFALPKVQFHPNGCGGICVPGCGCQIKTPLMSIDGGCYAADLMCPENEMSSSQRSMLFIQLLMSRTTAKPKTKATTTTTTTERTPVSTTLPATRAKLLCPKHMPILDRNYCECAGVFKQMSCVAQEGAECPYTCEGQPACPSLLSPRLKSAAECKKSECSGNYDCAPGYLCCELLCGRRCIKMD